MEFSEVGRTEKKHRPPDGPFPEDLVRRYLGCYPLVARSITPGAGLGSVFTNVVEVGILGSADRTIDGMLSLVLHGS